MAKRITFSTESWTAAPPAAVYRLVCDGASWPSWSPIGSFALEREGPTGGESVGAIRAFKTGIVRSREEILECRPDASFGYKLSSGLPIQAHRADVVLTAHNGGTTITWHEVFESKVPGADCPRASSCRNSASDAPKA